MRTVGVIALGTLVLLIPAFINGAPFLFFDTGEYARLGRALVGGMRDFDGSRLWLTFLGGRAVSYSLLLVALVKLGGFWLAALLQAMCGAFVLFWTVRVLAPSSRAGSYLALVALISVGTTAGLFVAFMMPDIFLAYGLLSALALVMGGRRLSMVTQGTLWLILVFSITAHATNVVIVGGALVLGIPAMMFASGRTLARSAASEGWSVAALVVAMLLVMGAAGAIRLAAGEPLRKPPYLMARVLADGPGRAWLAKHCATSSFAICRYRGKPLDNQNEILWQPDPSQSVVASADYDERVRLSEEEGPFVRAVLSEFPIQMARAAIGNGATQIFVADAQDEMGQVKTAWDVNLSPAFPTQARIMQKSLTYQGRWNWAIVTFVDRAMLLLALLFVVFRFAGADFRAALKAGSAEHRAAACIVAILLLVLLANAALCGALSGPSARYQGRVMWLLPAAAAMLGMRFGLISRPRRSASTRTFNAASEPG